MDDQTRTYATQTDCAASDVGAYAVGLFSALPRQEQEDIIALAAAALASQQ